MVYCHQNGVATYYEHNLCAIKWHSGGQLEVKPGFSEEEAEGPLVAEAEPESAEGPAAEAEPSAEEKSE